MALPSFALRRHDRFLRLCTPAYTFRLNCQHVKTLYLSDDIPKKCTDEIFRGKVFALFWHLPPENESSEKRRR